MVPRKNNTSCQPANPGDLTSLGGDRSGSADNGHGMPVAGGSASTGHHASVCSALHTVPFSPLPAAVITMASMTHCKTIMYAS